jgi:mannosyltransferase
MRMTIDASMAAPVLAATEVEPRPESSVSCLISRWWLATIVVLVIAAGLRIFAINSQSFWYDEAVTAQLTESSVADIYLGRTKDNGNPPLFWLCAKQWSDVFGRSEAGFRSFSVVCGVLAVLLLALLGRQLLGPQVGLLAAALLAVSPLQVELSNEARTYALLQFLAVANTWFFVRWVHHRRVNDLIVYGITTALGWYSHYYAPALQLSQAMALATQPACRKLWLPWIQTMIVAFLVWCAWLPNFVHQLRTPGNLTRVPGESWGIQFFATPVTFGLGRAFAWRDSPRWMVGIAVLGVLISLLFPLATGIVQISRRRFAAALLCGWLLVPILGPLIVALLGKPIYSHRYASIGLPAFLLLAAFGLQQFRLPWKAALLGLLVVLTSISLFRYATNPLKDDWRSAARTILARLDLGDLVVIDQGTEAVTYHYYATRLGRNPIESIGLKPDPGGRELFVGTRNRNGDRLDREGRDYSTEISSAPGLWLALCLPSVPADEYDSKLERLGFHLVERFSFYRVNVYRYVK